MLKLGGDYGINMGPSGKIEGDIAQINKKGARERDLKIGGTVHKVNTNDYAINIGSKGKVLGDVIQNNMNGSKGKEIKIGGTVTGNVHKFNSGCSDGKINVVGEGNVKGKFKTTQGKPCKS